MPYDVMEARYLGSHRLWLRFRDGTEGEIDLAPVLEGPVLGELREFELFRRFEIHEEFRTLVWPNGADLAPEFLHETVRAAA